MGSLTTERNPKPPLPMPSASPTQAFTSLRSGVCNISALKLEIAFWNYDRTSALTERTVKIDGVDARFHGTHIVTEIFEQAIRQRAFDVSELGMTYFLRALEVDSEFLAIPVFPNQAFRHSAIYVNKASGIQRAEDLAGKTIGELALYGHDAGVMPKGMLSDDYGLTPNQCHWLVGGIDFPMKPIDFVPQPHPADVEVKWAASDDDLGKNSRQAKSMP